MRRRRCGPCTRAYNALPAEVADGGSEWTVGIPDGDLLAAIGSSTLCVARHTLATRNKRRYRVYPCNFLRGAQARQQSSFFPPGCDIKAQRREIRHKLEATYEGLIDPGNWIKWIVENAPPRLAHQAADLRHFAVLSSPDDLEQLIRFHDAKRQFRRATLLSNARSLEMVLGVKIPPYITIDQAKKYEAKLAAKPKRVKVPLIATEYASESVHPFIISDPALNAVWKELEPHERRAVAALAALDERASPPDLPLCPDALAAQWPAPTGISLFAWHPKIGLGFVGETDHLDGDKAYVWLWRSGSYQRCKYNLQYWRGVKGCSEEAVQAVEQHAFSR